MEEDLDIFENVEFETQTDILTLLENIKCQSKHPGALKQALQTLASICSSNKECQDYFSHVGGIGELQKLLLGGTCPLPAVAATLFCLACAVKGNVACQKLILRTDMMELIHKLLTCKASPDQIIQSAAFLLACGVDRNGHGQTLSHDSECLGALVDLLRANTHSKDIDESKWIALTKAIGVCVNNPQNVTNQQLCCFIIPHLLQFLEESDGLRLFPDVLNLIGLIIANNASNQERFFLCGGVEILVLLIQEHKCDTDHDQAVNVVVSAVSALDACIAGLEKAGKKAGELNIVPILLDLLANSRRTQKHALALIITLAHVLEAEDSLCGELSEGRGYHILVNLLTDSQDEEIFKTVKYILSLCKSQESQSLPKEGMSSPGRHSSVKANQNVGCNLGELYQMLRKFDSNQHPSDLPQNMVEIPKEVLRMLAPDSSTQMQQAIGDLQRHVENFGETDGGPRCLSYASPNQLYDSMCEPGHSKNRGLMGVSYTSPKQIHSMDSMCEPGHSKDRGLMGVSYTSAKQIHGMDSMCEPGHSKDRGLMGVSYTSPKQIHGTDSMCEPGHSMDRGPRNISYTSPRQLYGNMCESGHSRHNLNNSLVGPEKSDVTSKRNNAANGNKVYLSNRSMADNLLKTNMHASTPSCNSNRKRSNDRTAGSDISGRHILQTTDMEQRRFNANKGSIEEGNINHTGQPSSGILDDGCLGSRRSRSVTCSRNKRTAVADEDHMCEVGQLENQNVYSRELRNGCHSRKSSPCLNEKSLVDRNCSRQMGTQCCHQTPVSESNHRCCRGDRSLCVQLDNNACQSVSRDRCEQTAQYQRSQGVPVSGHNCPREGVIPCDQGGLNSPSTPNFSGTLSERNKSPPLAEPIEMNASSQSLYGSMMNLHNEFQRMMSIFLSYLPGQKEDLRKDTTAELNTTCYVETKSPDSGLYTSSNGPQEPQHVFMETLNKSSEESTQEVTTCIVKHAQSKCKTGKKALNNSAKGSNETVTYTRQKNEKLQKNLCIEAQKDGRENFRPLSPAYDDSRGSGMKSPPEGDQSKLPQSWSPQSSNTPHLPRTRAGLGPSSNQNPEVTPVFVKPTAPAVHSVKSRLTPNVRRPAQTPNVRTAGQTPRAALPKTPVKRSVPPPPSPAYSEFDLMIKCAASKNKLGQLQSETKAHSSSTVLDADAKVSSSLCPGCLVGGHFNSRTYNIAIETSGSTCGYHRGLRRCENEHIHRAVSSDRAQRLLYTPGASLHSKPSTRGSGRSTKDVYDFTSEADSTCLSTPGCDISLTSVKAAAEKRRKERRHRVPYTESELANLEEGVQQLGKCWQQILCTYSFHRSRTSVDLMEKYKRLQKGHWRKSSPTSRQPFSMCEIRRLKRGVKSLGYNWKAILAGHRFAPGRKATELREMWRSLNSVHASKS